MLLFFTKALTASQTDLSLELAGYTSEVVQHATRGRAYKTLDVLATAAITAGTATVTVYKNGVSAGVVTLSTSAHRARKALTLGVEAGDRIEVKVTTSATFAPVTSDMLALIR